MDMNRMTIKLQEALQAASAQAMRRGHQGIDAEHLLLALLEQEDGLALALLEQSGVSGSAGSYGERGGRTASGAASRADALQAREGQQ